MNIKYVCPYWGCEKDTADTFMDKVISAGYDGVEIFLSSPDTFTEQFIAELEDALDKNPAFVFIAQHIINPVNQSVDDYINGMEKNLLELAAYQPAFINSHTGKDYYSFDDNCRVIEAALNISTKTGVRILHETHRGRFSFHAPSLLPYLKKFPELELVADFSHFCTVSESLLQGQQEIIQQIIPHVSHIHARVGHEQAPQVSDPAAPEWQNHLNRFIEWWQEIISCKEKQRWNTFTITPEFGPAPYMPAIPFTKQPVGNQWAINTFMMNKLKQSLK